MSYKASVKMPHKIQRKGVSEADSEDKMTRSDAPLRIDSIIAGTNSNAFHSSDGPDVIQMF